MCIANDGISGDGISDDCISGDSIDNGALRRLLLILTSRGMTALAASMQACLARSGWIRSDASSVVSDRMPTSVMWGELNDFQGSSDDCVFERPSPEVISASDCGDDCIDDGQRGKGVKEAKLAVWVGMGMPAPAALEQGDAETPAGPASVMAISVTADTA